MKRLSVLLLLCMAATRSRAAEYQNSSKYDVVSPTRSFVITQRFLAGDADDPSYRFQAWIRPERSPSYQLKLWHHGELSWAGDFHISPTEKYLLNIQKTGSGDNYGVVFRRRSDKRFVLDQSGSPASALSERMVSFFDARTKLKSSFYHCGIGFVSWGDDGQCLEISLHGSDTNEEYFVRDWRAHYHLESGKFFLSNDQEIHNRHSIIPKSG